MYKFELDFSDHYCQVICIPSDLSYHESRSKDIIIYRPLNTRTINDSNMQIINPTEIINNLNESKWHALPIHTIKLNDDCLNSEPRSDANTFGNFFEVPVKLIKKARYMFSPFLAKLINTSVFTETFPSDLKTADIIAVFKKSDLFNKTSYGPIALLSIFPRYLRKRYIMAWSVLYPKIKYFHHVNGDFSKISQPKVVVQNLFNMCSMVVSW